MFYNLFSTRAIQVGIAFFVLVVGGSLLYSWHVEQTTKAELAAVPPFQARPEHLNATATGTGGQPPSGLITLSKASASLQSDETTPETSEMDLSAVDFSKSLEIEEDFSPGIGFANESEPLPDSPLGYGAYPEVPTDYPTDFSWQGVIELYETDWTTAANVETLHRVLFKLWAEGKKATGGIIQNGLVYPAFRNTGYVEWSELVTPSGDVLKYASAVTTFGDTPDPLPEGRLLQKHQVPDQMTLIPFSEGGYDPSTFLSD